MKIISSTRAVFFDVDDTLVIWDWKQYNPNHNDLVKIVNENSGCMEMVMPHERHITLMRQFKARGHTVYVWSAGGADWAAQVCKVLDIENVVDYVIDKPNWYVDDLNSADWMKKPIFLHPTDASQDKRWGNETDQKENR